MWSWGGGEGSQRGTTVQESQEGAQGMGYPFEKRLHLCSGRLGSLKPMERGCAEDGAVTSCTQGEPGRFRKEIGGKEATFLWSGRHPASGQGVGHPSTGCRIRDEEAKRVTSAAPGGRRRMRWRFGREALWGGY